MVFILSFEKTEKKPMSDIFASPGENYHELFVITGF